MNEKPNYYAILPANVRYDTDLSPNAKLLYAEITSLAYKDGYCWATNNYFMDLYSASLASIKRWLKELKDKGYIDVCVNYIKGTKEVESRYITLTEVVSNLSRGGLKNEPRGGLKNEPDNIINKNIILEHKEKLNKKKFTPPTVEEVRAYCDERKNGIDAEYFVSHYKSNGWMVGKSPMKDWKSAVITWEKRNRKNNIVKDMNDVPTITYDDTNNPVF